MFLHKRHKFPTDVIICWNYLFLARALEQETDPVRKAEIIEAIRNKSVVTWRHFNLYGEFDFSDEKMMDSIGLTSPKSPPSLKLIKRNSAML